MDKNKKNQYDISYRKEHYDNIRCNAPREKELKYRLQLLSTSTKKSVNALLIDAIEKLLEREGL